MSAARLRDFVADFSHLLDARPAEPRILEAGGALLRRLVARDDWLPEEFARPDPLHYRQYLLHLDAAARFSVVSFVWGPGQATPVHDHTVWGLIGMLRGAEWSQGFSEQDGQLWRAGAPVRLAAGDVEAVSPSIGDVHQVRNAHDDRVSISIHVYGADIGTVRRHTYPAGGGRKPFVSGYSNSKVS
jgi:predicted metal-dependent enzyme (double-stranded beta helix superfamily)